MKVLTLQVLLLFIFALSPGLGIKCYDCNSHFDEQCDDPFKESSIEKVNCDGKMNPTNVNATFCRKMVQKSEKFWLMWKICNFHEFIFSVNEQIRIIRSCGYISDNLEDGKCRRNNPSKGFESYFIFEVQNH